jgi:hypothetical protein
MVKKGEGICELTENLSRETEIIFKNIIKVKF